MRVCLQQILMSAFLFTSSHCELFYRLQLSLTFYGSVKMEPSKDENLDKGLEKEVTG